MLCFDVVLKRSPFGLQNESFWWAKGVLLKGKRTTIGRQKESFWFWGEFPPIESSSYIKINMTTYLLNGKVYYNKWSSIIIILLVRSSIGLRSVLVRSSFGLRSVFVRSSLGLRSVFVRFSFVLRSSFVHPPFALRLFFVRESKIHRIDIKVSTDY